MKINTSYLIAAGVAVAFLAWFAVNSAGEDTNLYADIEARDQATEAVLPTVVVRNVTAEVHPIRLVAYGRTQAGRMVEVKAKTAASLIATPIAEGTRVRRGDVICRQDVDARQALVDQAQARLDQVEADFRATTTLVEKGFRSATSLKADRAAVDGARAQLKQAQIERGNIVLRAPFDGIYERRMAEVGDYLSPGQPCALIVELDPLKLDVEMTETQVGKIAIGQPVTVRLATGETVEGRVAFIESVANPATRTFGMEVSLPNGDGALKAGVSATIAMTIGQTTASLVPSGILTLDNDGIMGVRYLDPSDRVQFATITQVDETRDGIWVTGLPTSTRIIIEGQDYVSVGTHVTPVREADHAQARPASVNARNSADLN
ncbi:efflux RND transporter periplasmic adaptor subunit [Algimonas porphyrae]|uniref:Hemolysin D n=1 Tax=Algimonas porphyrae TaxID=1128113 RepID=A0ABQ5V0N8_9PROT|nr:efflux RND transporter periplasmic adaptor subunit [Algimonas porphyrae]GLQ20998.1 hemolysin D [Algimonas porphyrae]